MSSTDTNRIIEEQSIVRTREVVAPHIVIDWNPQDNTGKVDFHLKDEVTENGTYVGLQQHSRLRTIPEAMMRVELTELLDGTFTVGEQEFTGYQLMGMIKTVFDTVWNERYAVQIAADEETIEEETNV